MAVGHLTIRRYKINFRPENFRPMIFQWFGKAADLIVGQMLCPRFQAYEAALQLYFLLPREWIVYYTTREESKRFLPSWKFAARAKKGHENYTR